MTEVSQKEAVIHVANLEKVFRDFWYRPKVKALSGISFDVFKGEVFGFLGPNGAGKSTTIKIILGLLYATQGIVKVFDKLPSNVATKQKIGYLPEETYLYPYLNAQETLQFFGKMFNLSNKEIRDQSRYLLDLVGLNSVVKRKVADFSKGMKRRLGIAQSLINNPELLILDEPTSGLDPIGCREIKDLILQLASKGTTVFMSSHLLADVEDICDRVSILYDGKMQAIGSIDSLLCNEQISRVSFAALPKAEMEKVIVFLKDQIKANNINVDNPSKNLEEFFLDVVKKAKGAGITI